jgi:hypothetical protein
MEGFSYTLKYKPGATNENAHALSRACSYSHEVDKPLVESEAGDLGIEDDIPDVNLLRRRQQADLKWSETIRQLETGRPAQLSSLTTRAWKRTAY